MGVYFARKVRLPADFMVAGRTLGPGLIFSTFLAANIGAGSTVGAAALAYEMGWSAWWWVGSAGMGCAILALTVGPRIWKLARDHDLHTLGDYLEHRYDRKVRSVVAVILWVASLLVLAAQIIAISIILNVVAGVPRWQGCWIGGTVVIIYFAAGGLLSSAWVNLLELAVLLTGFVLAVPYAIESAGSWTELTGRLADRLGKPESATFLNPFGLGFGGVLYYVAFLAPSFVVSPGLIQKCYGARSEFAARAGIGANAVALLVFAALPPCLGIIAASRFPSLEDSQLALPMMLTRMLPEWLGILALAAVFSAEISTCDAVLFMLATSLTVDLYKTHLRPQASLETILRVSRITAVGSGLLGILLAILLPSIVLALTIFYSVVSVALFVPVVAGLYSSRPSSRGALLAILISVPSTLLIHGVWGDRILGFLNPVLLGILASFVVLWIASAARRKD